MAITYVTKSVIELNMLSLLDTKYIQKACFNVDCMLVNLNMAFPEQSHV